MNGTIGSCCSGCGGLDLGLAAAGWRTIWQAENDVACSYVLSRRFPGIPNLGDLAGIRWETVERPDVIAAGFPCQPLSLAGRGLIEADPRWLWPEVARAIRVLRPRLVLLENVPGIFRRPPSGGPRPIGVVLADLAALGYDAIWTSLRASDVGAPHERDRWFCVASESERPGIDADGRVRRGGPGEPRGPAQEALSAGPEVARATDALADRPGAPADAGGVARPTSRELDKRSGAGEVEGERGDPGEAERRATGRDRAGSEAPADADDERPPRRSERDGEAEAGLDGPRGRDADRRDLEDAGSAGVGERREQGVEWGIYEPAIRRWEDLLGRAAPRPTDDRGRLAPEFVTWMLGLPEGWVDVGGIARTEQLRMLGNAVVVQCGEVVGRWLSEVAA